MLVSRSIEGGTIHINDTLSAIGKALEFLSCVSLVIANDPDTMSLKAHEGFALLLRETSIAFDDLHEQICGKP
jgi:hypothetical protein